MSLLHFILEYVHIIKLYFQNINRHEYKVENLIFKKERGIRCPLRLPGLTFIKKRQEKHSEL